MVTLDVPLEFCLQAGERAGCTNRKCDGLHLCPFFVKESCKFGEKCKRSHNYRDEHTISVLKHFRLDFLKTSLLQNILKTILNESEIQRAASSRSVPDICKFYNKAPVCKKGEHCPCLHVCEHFIDGDCKFGEKCKRKHDFSDSHNVRVLKEFGMHGISELKVLQRLQGRERKRTVSASSDGEKPEQFKPASAVSNALSSSQASDDKEKDTEICGFNLRGQCNYGNSCIHRHTELPYIWEFAAEGDDKWESFSSDLNMMLEHAYCDVSNNSSATLTIKGFLYHIRFQDMTAVAVLPIADPMAKSPKVRRLSTVSSVVAAAGHVFSTKWQWYWKDESDQWQSYDTPGDGHDVNTTSSQCLERDYVAEKDSHSFSASHHKYTLYFKGWYQQNDVHKTKRPVTRRPAEFVNKQNMKDISQRRRAAGLWPGQQAHQLPLNQMVYHPIGLLFLMARSTPVKLCRPSLMNTRERKRNFKRQWMRKSRMAKKSGKEPGERQLFHGTNSTTAKAICQQGFDWRMCGRHGTTYGKGSYFACKANYSHRFSNHEASSRGLKQMFLANVVVGSYTNGSSKLTRPPPRDPSKPECVVRFVLR
ncbi:polymerase, member 12 [Desmophyllum pertusum]|uniref:Polymerase, member 12 n=1 Tax=Desmophyllum pertusum TaxID=174260 RepID=A0A9W9ZDU4_9CNID|nr:polymerase, member 12 [Desmophyllum pertusum]